MDYFDFDGSSEAPGPTPSFPDVNRDGTHDTRDVGTMWYLWNQTEQSNRGSYYGGDGWGAGGWIIVGLLVGVGLVVLMILS